MLTSFAASGTCTYSHMGRTLHLTSQENDSNTLEALKGTSPWPHQVRCAGSLAQNRHDHQRLWGFP